MSDVVVATPMLTKDEESLAAITSFADAMALIESAGIEIHSTEEYGDGFKLLTTADKTQLVGVPFVVLGIKFAEGDYGDDFAIIHLVTEDGRKCIITDGSTGIRAQAKRYAEKGITAGLLVPRGLVQSDYTYLNDKGVETPATTFYLS